MSSRSLLATISAIACTIGLSAAAHAENAAAAAEQSPTIVVRDGVNLNTPPPAGAFDNVVGKTGVGQVVIRPNQATTGVGLCTGTLINPRTVIFAAHCVNNQDANSYGFASGGTAMSVGFGADNLPGLRRWLGLDGGTKNATHLPTNIFNVEQVWYDPRSVDLGFLEADIALATLDTHADGIPTWTMLFSPLTAETHAVITGYGGRGIGASGANQGIDFRRRIAENMISSLSSLNDIDSFLFGPDDYGLPQSLYLTDFDSPAGQAAFNTNPAAGAVSYDFDLFDGAALPNEGTTAGGDSGGPLIADRAFAKPVVVGVLSGGSRYFGPQPFSSYGTSSFYQPLFMFWNQIVSNNSYAYVSSLAGNGDWMDPSHWVQTMDPNYAVGVNGQLVNALPSFSAPGVSGETPKFGKVCFLNDCQDLSGLSVPIGFNPRGGIVEGGPGTTGFVPNNVVGNPARAVKSQYYEVTLSATGKTALSTNVTIDRLNISGPAQLDIASSGALKIWGDYTQTGGTLILNGTLVSGEAFLGEGTLSGRGRFDPTFLTSLLGRIVPGTMGTTAVLTIAGDVILSSASIVFFDVGRFGGDTLAIVGDAQNNGVISLAGTAAVANAPGLRSARFGQTFEIVRAQGGVLNRFNSVTGTRGVLYPELEYLPNSVIARMRAYQFGDLLAAGGISDPFSLAFGNALDGLRASSYNELSNVYSLIDVLEVGQLSRTLQGLSASVAGRATTLDEKQSGRMRSLITDRLSMLGTAQAPGGTLRILGARDVLQPDSGLTETSASQLSLTRNYQSSTWGTGRLPENVSGFMAASFTRSSLGDLRNDGRTAEGSWHISSGLEIALNDRTTIASAFGHAKGEQTFSGGRSSVVTYQAAAYGSYRLGSGLYLGGQASFAQSRIKAIIPAGDGHGIGSTQTSAVAMIGEIEAGRNFQVGDIYFTPRASLSYSSYDVRGFADNRGDLALNVDSISRRGFEAKAGLKIAGSAKLGGGSKWSLHPEVKMDFVRRLSGNDTNLQVRFREAEAIGINLPIALQDASYGELKGGFKLTNGTVELGATVESRIGGELYRDDRAALNMAVRF